MSCVLLHNSEPQNVLCKPVDKDNSFLLRQPHDKEYETQDKKLVLKTLSMNLVFIENLYF